MDTSHSSATNQLKARRLGVHTQAEAVVFMHKDCSVCRSEGFAAHSRVLLRAGTRHVIATLYQVTGDFLHEHEAGLSESAWTALGVRMATQSPQHILIHSNL